MLRDSRQTLVYEWISRTFGEENVTQEQRAIRFLEKAAELYQSAGADRNMAHKIIDFVFDRPPGTIGQEIGGVGITLLGLAEACGLSADAEEAKEFRRVLLKDTAHFRERNEAKNEAGFKYIAPLASVNLP